jgi:hypothetical protein
MAPLPPESTARMWLDYTDGINEHSLCVRVGPTATLPNMINMVDDFMSTQQAAFYLLTVLGARVASDNSNVTNPFTWTGASTYGSGTMPAATSPAEIRYIGRSVDGRMVSCSLYGCKLAIPGTFRYLASAQADVAAAIAVLESGPAQSIFLTISTSTPVWKQYASYNFNSYWERKARG